MKHTVVCYILPHYTSYGLWVYFMTISELFMSVTWAVSRMPNDYNRNLTISLTDMVLYIDSVTNHDVTVQLYQAACQRKLYITITYSGQNI